ncbi:MAG: HAD hydrolase-like protein [Desulfurococcus sp.]|nr:HAD hydrolase-like protein [Desulfurococcus sp.]
MSLRLVLLDYDLTLVYNLMDFYEAYTGALEKYEGGSISFSEFLYLLNSNRLSERIPTGVQEEEFWRYFRRIYVSRHPYQMPGASDLLRLLKALSVKITVVSGRETSSEYIWRDLRVLGLDDYVDEVYTSLDIERLGGFEEYLFDKSWLISYILGRHGLKPCNALCIGDFTTDLYSCRKLGIPFIGVSLDDYRSMLLKASGSGIVVKNLLEVLQWIPVIKETIRC